MSVKPSQFVWITHRDFNIDDPDAYRSVRYYTTRKIHDATIIGKMINDYYNYISWNKIAEQYGYTLNQARNFARKNKLHQLPKRYDREHAKIIDMYVNQHKNCVEISKEYGCGNGVIIRILKQNNISLRPMSEIKRKYPIDETYFDEINTQDKAYLLGLYYADGYNNEKTRKVKLSLARKDEALVTRVRDIISPNRPLYYYKRNNVDSVTVTLCNKHMSEVMARHGCMQAKTFKVTFPTFLHPDLIPHFIRGYFDGDGCITFCRNKPGSAYIKYYINIVGTESFVMTIQSIFRSQVNCNSNMTIRHPEHNNNIRQLGSSGNRQIKRVLDWLYKDATIYLERKYQRYRALCQKCDEVDAKKERVRVKRETKRKTHHNVDIHLPLDNDTDDDNSDDEGENDYDNDDLIITADDTTTEEAEMLEEILQINSKFLNDDDDVDDETIEEEEGDETIEEGEGEGDETVELEDETV